MSQEEEIEFNRTHSNKCGKKTCRGYDLATGIMYIEATDKLVIRKQRTLKIGNIKVQCVLSNSKTITSMTDIEVKNHIEFGRNLLKTWFKLNSSDYQQDSIIVHAEDSTVKRLFETGAFSTATREKIAQHLLSSTRK